MCNNNMSYLQFNSNDFTNFINFVKSMNVKNSKTAVLHVENNLLVCRAVDDSSSIIEFDVELCGTENIITEPISVSIEDLSVLVKSAFDGDKFSIRKCFGQYEFNVIGNGWIPFKVYPVDLSKYEIDGSECEIGTVNSIKLRNSIQTVLGYMQDYVYARDKYLQFNENFMVVTSRLASVVTKDSFVNMTIRRDIAVMLKSLLKDDFTLTVKRITSDIERLLFYGDKFRLCVIADNLDSSGIEYNDNLKDFITVNCEELYKLVLFSEEYTASKHIIGISVKDSKLNVSIKNILASNHNSVIKSSVVGDVKDTSNELEISSCNLFKALKLFQDKHTKNINIYTGDDIVNDYNSIVIFDENTQATVNINN